MRKGSPGERGSYHEILRSSAMFGGASVIGIAAGVLRLKAAALLVGVAGVGLIGLFNNLVLAGATVGGVGLANAATRQIAAERSRSGAEGEKLTVDALRWATLVLALLSTILVFAFRKVIAEAALGSSSLAPAVGWLSIAVGLSILASSLLALLAGLREIAAMARAYAAGGVLALILGVAALWQFGGRALVVFVIALPLANVISAGWFVGKRASSRPARDLGTVWIQSRQMVRLGSAFMLSQFAAYAAQLGVRAAIHQRLGVAELGFFQADWAIAMTYLGVILQAMAADYYPRLTESIHVRDRAIRIVREQTEVALLLAAPIILAAIALAPLALDILYSSDFRPAAGLLRLQMLGDILKVASWPLGFVLLAANRAGFFLISESIGWLMFLAATWLLAPRFGLEAAGIAYLAMYSIYFPAVLIASRAIIGPSWTGPLFLNLTAVGAAAVGVIAVERYDATAGAVVGLSGAAVFAAAAARKLHRRTRTSEVA